MENQLLKSESNGLSVSMLKAAIRQPMHAIAGTAIIIGLGLYLNWPTVVALGLAPLVLTFAPCALMCALGVCGMTTRKSAPEGKQPAEDHQP